MGHSALFRLSDTCVVQDGGTGALGNLSCRFLLTDKQSILCVVPIDEKRWLICDSMLVVGISWVSIANVIYISHK